MNLIKIGIAFICLGASTISKAQLMTSNNVTISILSGAQVTVKGDIQNNAGSTMANDATIDLTGNWINNSGNNCFGASQGTVFFNGINQLIGGSSSTVFNNLNLVNGVKTMEVNTTTGGGNITPAGILNCNNAVLDLNSKTLTVNNSNSSAVSNTAGYILSEDADNSSKVTWKIGSTPGLHTIPFGNSTAVQIPYSINVTAGNIGDVTVSTYQTISNNTPYPILPLLVTHVKNAAGADNSANLVDRFWQVDKTGTGTATYTFSYAGTENAANGNTNLRAQIWNNSTVGWETGLTGQTNPTSQSVTVPGVVKSGAWALSLQASPLPVELISFSADVKDNKNVICNWSTASEKNNDYFTLLRSKDGISFEEISTVDGAGNSNILLNYSYTDLTPYTGVSYYRLKQTDFNGDVSYSKTVSVLITSEEIKYVVYPNPSEGTFYIKYNRDDNQNNMYAISDAAGRMVSNGILNDISGLQSITLNGVSKGFYFLKIKNGDQTFCSKLQVIY